MNLLGAILLMAKTTYLSSPEREKRLNLMKIQSDRLVVQPWESAVSKLTKKIRLSAWKLSPKATIQKYSLLWRTALAKKHQLTNSHCRIEEDKESKSQK